MVFVDGQNLFFKCRAHFGWPWAHPRLLAEALVREDQKKYGADSHCLSAVRYYTGIHDANYRPEQHAQMERRLEAYKRSNVEVFPIPLRYDNAGLAREKGVDARIALDLTRLGWKGLFDVAIIVSEDSALDPAAHDLYELRDRERWIAVENALPWSTNSHARWLPSVHRRRVITQEIFDRVKDVTVY